MARIPANSDVAAQPRTLWAVYKSAWFYGVLLLAFIVSPALAFSSVGLALVLIVLGVALRSKAKTARALFAISAGAVLGSLPYLIKAMQAYQDNIGS